MKKLSRISAMHYIKLVYRSLLFLSAVVLYVVGRVRRSPEPFGGLGRSPLILGVIWLVYVAEMICRFFPAPTESMGCQKQFARNYRPVPAAKPVRPNGHGLPLVVISWLSLNGAIGAAYFLGWIDKGILLLVSLAYSVCDLICILFFCPFQTWMMRNKCCGSCRIYNWDFAMMFTPMIFIPGIYTWSLLALAVALLIRWEVAVLRHPERFSEATNASLSCANCKEKLCHHKKQLRKFLRENRQRLSLLGNTAELLEKLKK